jgi:hypothetical protein
MPASLRRVAGPRGILAASGGRHVVTRPTVLLSFAVFGCLSVGARQGADAEEEPVRRGVSKQAAVALEAAAERAGLRFDEEDAREQAEDLRRLAELSADVTKRMRTSLERQKEYAALRREYDAIVALPPGTQPLPKDYLPRAAALRRLREKYDAVRKAARRDAGIDDAALTSAAARIFGKRAKAPPTAAADTGVHILLVEEETPEADAAPTAFTITAPYANRTLFERTKGLFNHANAEADKGEGTFTVNVNMTSGGSARARAVLGEFVTVASGFTSLKVTVKLRHRTFSDGSSKSHYGIGTGWSDSDTVSAYSRAVVQLTSTDGEARRKYYTFVSAHVSGAWASESGEFDGPYTFTKTFSIPSSGGEYLVQAGGSVSIYTNAGFSGYNQQHDVLLESIRVEPGGRLGGLTPPRFPGPGPQR